MPMITRRLLLGSVAALAAATSSARAVAAAARIPLARTLSGARLAAAEAARVVAPAASALDGRIFYKGAAAYEDMRARTTWNARKPPRFPNAVVMAESEADVIAAVKLAKTEGWQVSARSGGHSWNGSHTRNDGMLINLSRMQDVSVDPKTRIASVNPAVQGQVLAKALTPHGLMFPTGHCFGVGLGGFVMCGGHGWNSRVWGPACASLVGVDVVTAEGALIHADADTHADYLWAARGAGPGFFGVATRYYLRVYPRPTAMRMSSYVFPVSVLDELLTWVRDNANGFPKFLEVVLIGSARSGAPQIVMNGTALAYSEKDARDALALLEGCPVAQRASTRKLDFAVEIPRQVEAPDDINPTGARFAVDNMWTSSPSSELVPMMRRFFTEFPTRRSYVFWQCWAPVQELPDMAYSIQGDIYLSANAVYADPADDARCDAWVKDSMKRMELLAIGSQMNDENMGARPSRYLSEDAARRLEMLRATYDPDRIFTSFLEA